MKIFNKKYIKLKLAVGVVAVFVVVVLAIYKVPGGENNMAAVTAAVGPTFLYSFNVDGVLSEAGSFNESTSPYWWLDSGGEMILTGGKGETIQGDLNALNINDKKWRDLYAKGNPVDTDLGLHPQNLFRLISRSLWQTVREEAYFTVARDELSLSPNRNESNGLLLFSRYVDSANLYYAGVRVDGAAVIKKKINGVYTTLSYVPGIFPGKYNNISKASLIPKNKEIGLRTETYTDTSSGKTVIKLYINIGNGWNKIAEASDDSKSIDTPSHVGIRTDFMDVIFDNYKIEKI